jgi:plastocyanin
MCAVQLELMDHVRVIARLLRKIPQLFWSFAMKASTICSAIVAATSTVIVISAAAHNDHRDKDRDVVTVAFGAGLNTAQPGNEENHHILPQVIKVNVGDVVNFAVAGLHVIRVYDRGVRLRDVRGVIPDECEMNPTPPETFPPQCFVTGPTPPVIPPLGLDVYYEGLNALGPPPQTPPFAPFSLAQNRIESVVFLEPGRYLVICAVLDHFNDKMYAWVEVSWKDKHDR